MYRRQPQVDPVTVASIQTVFARSALSHQGWRYNLPEGRLASRDIWKNDATGTTDIFRERRAPSPTKVNVWLLVDASGSMKEADKDVNAQDVTATLIAAFARIPTVRLHVYQHNADADVYIYRVFDGGINAVTKMLERNGRANADGFALEAIGNKALRDVRKGERTLVIVLSDGMPSVHGRDASNRDLPAHSATIATRLRLRGAKVMSVSIDSKYDKVHAQMYGAENVVPFNGAKGKAAWGDLARDFGRVFGRMLHPRTDRAL